MLSYNPIIMEEGEKDVRKQLAVFHRKEILTYISISIFPFLKIMWRAASNAAG